MKPWHINVVREPGDTRSKGGSEVLGKGFFLYRGIRYVDGHPFLVIEMYSLGIELWVHYLLE